MLKDLQREKLTGGKIDLQGDSSPGGLSKALSSKTPLVKKLSSYEQELMFLLLNFNLKNLTEIQLYMLQNFTAVFKHV